MPSKQDFSEAAAVLVRAAESCEDEAAARSYFDVADWLLAKDIATTSEKAIDAAIAEEREACAKVAGTYLDWCANWGQYKNQDIAQIVQDEIAAAIRART